MVSQYDTSVKAAWRDSACGPTATHIVLSHYGLTYSINELYRTLGTTRLGLFTPCLIRNAKRLLGDDFIVARASEHFNSFDHCSQFVHNLYLCRIKHNYTF